MTIRLAIVLFEDVELLDFAGPLEVFSAANQISGEALFDLVCTAPESGPVRTHNGLVVQADCALSDCPPVDWLLIPGGIGTRTLMSRPEVMAWLDDRAGHAARLLSVCTGALVLGACGYLDGREATTHHENLDELQAVAPTCRVRRDRRWVRSETVSTAAGVSAGIDMSLALVAECFGDDLAERTARYIEYPYPD